MYIPTTDDATAKDALVANLDKLSAKDREFAESMLGQLEKKGTLSPKQWPWIRKLAERSLAGPKPEVKLDLSQLLAMFDHAAGHAKFPKITVQTSEGTVQLSRAGDKAKMPGTINVTDGGPYGANRWYGRILLDGKWQMPGDTPAEWIIAIVKRLATDPTGAAMEYAKVSGSCCFCNKAIDTEESKAVGYGPVCAKKFGLPWGGKAGAVVEEGADTAADAGIDCEECFDEGYKLAADGGLLPCMKCNAHGQQVAV